MKFENVLCHLRKNVDFKTACYAEELSPQAVLAWAEKQGKLQDIKTAEAYGRLQLIETLNAAATAGDIPAIKELRTLVGYDPKGVQRDKVVEEIMALAQAVLDDVNYGRLLRAIYEAEE